VHGFVELATCNRNEWIVAGGDPEWAAALLSAEMRNLMGSTDGESVRPYQYVREAAVQHVFRVALGQESLVVGERQIAGQLFKAMERARELGTSARLLNGLGTVAARLVRRAVRGGHLSGDARGVHSLAVQLLRERLTEPAKRSVAVVGVGMIGRRVLGLLEELRLSRLVVVNRTLLENRPANWRPLAQLEVVLDEVDAAVVCTGACTPVIHTADLPLRDEAHPLLVVDLGVPAQVERGELPAGVVLVGLDELATSHLHSRTGETQSPHGRLQELLDEALAEFQVFCGTEVLAGLLDSVERRHRRLVTEELARLVDTRMAYVPGEFRGRLREDLKSIVLEYMDETINSVREASATLARAANSGPGPVPPWPCEPHGVELEEEQP
jgi:glutamyl-tRNA reductase